MFLCLQFICLAENCVRSSCARVCVSVFVVCVGLPFQTDNGFSGDRTGERQRQARTNERKKDAMIIKML